MRITRPINTCFWRDDKILNLNSLEKLLFLYLMTNADSNLLGVYELPPLMYIAMEIGLPMSETKQVEEMLNKLEKNGFIKWSKSTNEIAILNFLKHSVMGGGLPIEKSLKKTIRETKNKALLGDVYEKIHNCPDLNKTVLRILPCLIGEEVEDNTKNKKDIWEKKEVEELSEDKKEQLNDLIKRIKNS